MNNKLFPNVKKMTTIFAVAIFAVTVGILLLRLTALSNRVTPSDSPNASVPNEDSTTPDLRFTMDDRVVFDTAQATGSLKIQFPKENTQSIRFTIHRKDTEKEMFSSKTVLPGDKSVNIKLAKTDLAAGDYPCVVTITSYDLETDKKITEFTQDLTIVVKNDTAS